MKTVHARLQANFDTQVTSPQELAKGLECQEAAQAKLDGTVQGLLRKAETLASSYAAARRQGLAINEQRARKENELEQSIALFVRRAIEKSRLLITEDQVGQIIAQCMLRKEHTKRNNLYAAGDVTEADPGASTADT